MKLDVLKNQKGFTLVEIIAVLIILGILAAVATPKFFDMQVEAEKKALQAAVAELNSQVTLSWAQCKLKGIGTGTDQCATAYGGYDGDLGNDFTITAQSSDTPATGTIKLANGNDTYALTWADATDNAQSPGRFTLGAVQ